MAGRFFSQGKRLDQTFQPNALTNESNKRLIQTIVVNESIERLLQTIIANDYCKRLIQTIAIDKSAVSPNHVSGK
jgi:hypothetical protein